MCCSAPSISLSAFLDELPDRSVGRPVYLSGLRAASGGALPEEGEDPVQVIDRLAR
jgi:hypothetical protein